jgi:hypothetical protein
MLIQPHSCRQRSGTVSLQHPLCLSITYTPKHNVLHGRFFTEAGGRLGMPARIECACGPPAPHSHISCAHAIPGPEKGRPLARGAALPGSQTCRARRLGQLSGRGKKPTQTRGRTRRACSSAPGIPCSAQPGQWIPSTYVRKGSRRSYSAASASSLTGGTLASCTKTCEPTKAGSTPGPMN